MPCHQKSFWSQKDENSDNLVSPPLCLASIVRFEHFRIPSVCLSLPSLSPILSLFLSLILSFSLFHPYSSSLFFVASTWFNSDCSLSVSLFYLLPLPSLHSLFLSSLFLSFPPAHSKARTLSHSLYPSFSRLWKLGSRCDSFCSKINDPLKNVDVAQLEMLCCIFLWESCHFAATSLEPVLNWLCHFATHDTPRPSCWYRLFWLHGKFMSLEERSFKLFKPWVVKSNSSGRMFP